MNFIFTILLRDITSIDDLHHVPIIGSVGKLPEISMRSHELHEEQLSKFNDVDLIRIRLPSGTDISHSHAIPPKYSLGKLGLLIVPNCPVRTPLPGHTTSNEQKLGNYKKTFVAGVE